MKKLLFLSCFSFLIFQSVNAQKNDPANTASTQALHDNYIQKSKTYKTAGWVILGTGIGMLISGGIIYANYADQGFNGPRPKTGETLIIAGAGAALASIPFFILAKSNKTKATLALKGETVTFGNKLLQKSNYTALALTIKLTGHKRALR